MGPTILNSDEENPNLSIGEDSAGSLSAMEMLHGCSSGGGQVEDEEGKKKRNKERFQWTDSLHSKFVTAVDQLGGPEKAIPSEIMRAMNVHGLTRLIVASHLQKYRAKIKGVKEREQVAVPISPLPLSEDGPNQLSSSERGGILNQNRRKKNHTDETSNADTQSNIKKARFSWTPNIQKKFVATIESIGLENAVPKKILDAMGIEGLSRHIIASHLKKYHIQLKKEMDSQQLKKEKERQQLTFII